MSSFLLPSQPFFSALSNRKLAIIPWCGEEQCEKSIKVQSAIDSKYVAEQDASQGVDTGEKLTGAAKSLCVPFEQPQEDVKQYKCVKCQKDSATWVLFGRSY